MALDLSKVTDADLATMTDRAYREAARCWAETRKSPASFGVIDPLSARALGAMLYDAAQSAEDYWRALRFEQDRRKAQTVSPFVRRARAGELPAKVVS